MAKLPSVTSPLPPDLNQFIQRVREAIDGGGMDGLITARQMVVAGIASFSASGISSPSVQITETPSSPSGLTAAGALGNVILNWGTPTHKGHAYTEIWAHTSDVIGDAVLVGMTAGTSFVHSLGSAATRYYWIRSVNQDGIAGAYNATNGVQGSTSQDPAYLMDVLAKDYGVTSDAPFFQIDQDTTINTVVIPAGTYMKTAFIHDASITNAMIGTAAIDTAKIADAAITTAKITDANITNAKIANLAVDSAKMANAAITTAKIADANITNAKIANLAVDDAKMANAAITTAKIADAAITTAKITDATVTNAKIAALAVDSAKMADAAITSAKIASAAITDAKIDSLSAGKISTGTLDVERITNGDITSTNAAITSGSTSVNTSSSSPTAIQSVNNVVTRGGVLLIQASCVINAYVRVVLQLRQGTTVLRTLYGGAGWGGYVSFSGTVYSKPVLHAIVHQEQAAGSQSSPSTNSFSLTAYSTNSTWNTTLYPSPANVSNRSLIITELKR
jgi:hypothetical protein